MTIHLEFWPALAFAVVVFSWAAFALMVLSRMKPP